MKRFHSSLIILFILPQFLFANETKISGTINAQEGSIQLLRYQNPLTETLILIDEVSPNVDGLFDFRFSLDRQEKLKILFKESSFDLYLNPGTSLNVELTYIQFKKANEFGRNAKLDLVRKSSGDQILNYLIEVESDVKEIRQKHRKSNGSLSKKYIGELGEFLKKEISSGDQRQLNALANTPFFANEINSLQRAKYKSADALLQFFNEQFQTSSQSFDALTYLYGLEIQIEFFRKHLKEDYIRYISESVSAIDLKTEAKQALYLGLLSTATGRKWVRQSSIQEALKRYITEVDNDFLTGIANELIQFQESDLLGSSIQDFTFKTLDGSEVSFEQFRGKYLLIDFWATWCGPCVKSMKKLPEILAGSSEKVEVLCITDENDPNRIKKFIQRMSISSDFHIVISKDVDLLNSYFKKRAIPLYYLISPDGIVLAKAVADPKQMIEKYLK